MTLTEIRDLLVTVDPQIRHYFSMSDGADYTYWEEEGRLPFTADGVHQEGWTFYVHRYTHDPQDPVAAALFALLDADPRTAVSVTHDYEPDTGYIHHAFRVEGF